MSIALLFSCRLGKQSIDYLQSAFSLKTRLVLISANAIANHDVLLQKGIGSRREKTNVSYFFFSCLRPRLSRISSYINSYIEPNFGKRASKRPKYSHRNLAILVTAVRILIEGLLSWLVSSSSCHGVGRGLHVNPWGRRLLQKRGMFS